MRAWTNMGISLANLADYDASARYYVRALALNPRASAGRCATPVVGGLNWQGGCVIAWVGGIFTPWPLLTCTLAVVIRPSSLDCTCDAVQCGATCAPR